VKRWLRKNERLGNREKEQQDVIMMESRYGKEKAQEMSMMLTAVREGLPTPGRVSIRGKSH